MKKNGKAGHRSLSIVAMNWQCFDEKKPLRFLEEARLFTDSRIIGEVRGLGPYSFLNPFAQPRVRFGNPLIAGIVIRASTHVLSDLKPSPMKDDFEHYHGGDMFDELAALLSLFMGIRIKAGGIDRMFFDLDPLGKPIGFFGKAEPQLVISDRPQIPSLGKEGRLGERAALGELDGIEQIPVRDPADTNAFVKAARLYQQAIWIADSDPELAWLLLVSCVETVAVVWAENSGSPVERLREAIPGLHKLLASELKDEPLLETATLLGKYVGATGKFVDFLSEFFPEPPPIRPPPFLCFDFHRRSVRKAASTIYGHRSAYLHGGTAIPLPMCEPPVASSFPDLGPGYSEIPQGLATGARGATWTIKKTPMLLRTFEHIARGAVLKWWRTRGMPLKRLAHRNSEAKI